MNNYELIKERAEILYELLDERVNFGHGHCPIDYLDGFKVAFALKNKSIKLFKKAFRQSGLDFDLSSVEVVYEDFAHELPGYKGMMDEEREIINELKQKLQEEGSSGNVISYRSWSN